MWRGAFPRSLREVEEEKRRGDAFTWQLTMESRSGALCGNLTFCKVLKAVILELNHDDAASFCCAGNLAHSFFSVKVIEYGVSAGKKSSGFSL